MLSRRLPLVLPAGAVASLPLELPCRTYRPPHNLSKTCQYYCGTCLTCDSRISPMPSAAFFGSPPADAPPPASPLLPGGAAASTPLESPASMREAPTHPMPACRQAGSNLSLTQCVFQCLLNDLVWETSQWAAASRRCMCVAVSATQGSHCKPCKSTLQPAVLRTMQKRYNSNTKGCCCPLTMQSATPL